MPNWDSQEFQRAVEEAVESVRRQMYSRAVRASNELRNAALEVLSGPRSGRAYKKPRTFGKSSAATRKLMKYYGHKLRGGQLYRASAPGEPPALRIGTLRESWKPCARNNGDGTAIASIRSEEKYASKLEKGTSRMKPRPYREAVIQRARPRISAIMKEPFL